MSKIITVESDVDKQFICLTRHSGLDHPECHYIPTKDIVYLGNIDISSKFIPMYIAQKIPYLEIDQTDQTIFGLVITKEYTFIFEETFFFRL